jgi:alpha,alpha-trehalose phosphorylase
VTALEAPGRLVVSSELVTPEAGPGGETLDPRQSRQLAPGSLRPGIEHEHGVRVVRTYRTCSSGLTVATGVDHQFDDRTVSHLRTRLDPRRAHVLFEMDAQVGVPVGIIKWLAYHWASPAPATRATTSGTPTRTCFPS